MIYFIYYTIVKIVPDGTVTKNPGSTVKGVGYVTVELYGNTTF
jgi:hypothetical protein